MRALVIIGVVLSLCATSAEAQQSFNAFYNANRDRRTAEGTIDDVYNRTFKRNTIGRWKGRRRPLALLGTVAKTVAPRVKGLRWIGRASSALRRPWRVQELAGRLATKDSPLNGRSKLRDAFYLSCLVSPAAAKVGLGVTAASWTASAAHKAKDLSEAPCLSRAAVYAAAHGAGLSGVGRSELDRSRVEVTKLLAEHDGVRRRAAATIRRRLERWKQADAELRQGRGEREGRGGRGALGQTSALARKLVHDEVITANLSVLRREHRAISGIKRVLERLDLATARPTTADPKPPRRPSPGAP